MSSHPGYRSSCNRSIRIGRTPHWQKAGHVSARLSPKLPLAIQNLFKGNIVISLAPESPCGPSLINPTTSQIPSPSPREGDGGSADGSHIFIFPNLPLSFVQIPSHTLPPPPMPSEHNPSPRFPRPASHRGPSSFSPAARASRGRGGVGSRRRERMGEGLRCPFRHGRRALQQRGAV